MLPCSHRIKIGGTWEESHRRTDKNISEEMFKVNVETSLATIAHMGTVVCIYHIPVTTLQIMAGVFQMSDS